MRLASRILIAAALVSWEMYLNRENTYGLLYTGLRHHGDACGCLGFKCTTREENTSSVTGGGQMSEGTPEERTLLKMVLILIDQSKSLT